MSTPNHFRAWSSLIAINFCSNTLLKFLICLNLPLNSSGVRRENHSSLPTPTVPGEMSNQAKVTAEPLDLAAFSLPLETGG